MQKITRETRQVMADYTTDAIEEIIEEHQNGLITTDERIRLVCDELSWLALYSLSDLKDGFTRDMGSYLLVDRLMDELSALREAYGWEAR